MNNNVDVIKQLEVKNREIYLNKLAIDLDNNFDVLSITIDNFINLFTNEIINKILEIENGTFNKIKITTCVTSFQNNLKEEIMKLVSQRKNNLLAKLEGIDKGTYEELIKIETEQMLSAIETHYEENINYLYIDLSEQYNDFDKKRLKDYLMKLHYDKFILKLKESFNNTNVILINNYKESYQKFLDLNAKTLK